MGFALELAKRITSMKYEQLPAEAVKWTKISLVDTIASALAGAGEAGPRIAEKVLGFGGKSGGNCLVWGTNHRTVPLDAASINGTTTHALDYDYCNNALAGHPSAALLPAIIALG